MNNVLLVAGTFRVELPINEDRFIRLCYVLYIFVLSGFKGKIDTQ